MIRFETVAVVAWVVFVGGLVLGVILRSMIWHWYIRCPRRFSFWLAALIEEWERRTGFTHVHVSAGESALPLERLSTMLRRYGRGDAPNSIEGA